MTPPGSVISVPPHTDRQDVIVFQTEGSKRWRVFDPPKRIKGTDPLNRGKSGDVLQMKDLGMPVLDVVLRKGDGMCDLLFAVSMCFSLCSFVHVYLYDCGRLSFLQPRIYYLYLLCTTISISY